MSDLIIDPASTDRLSSSSPEVTITTPGCTTKVITFSDPPIHLNRHRNGPPSQSNRLTPLSDSTDDSDSGNISTTSETWEESFSAINERKVTEVTINFFYEPRTLTLLFVNIVALAYAALVRNEEIDPASNIAVGLYSLSFLFLSIGLLVFPNGPFTRPHPAIWRLVFGIGFLYWLVLAFLLFQRFSDVRTMLVWIDPALNTSETDSTKLYALDCSFTWDNLYGRMDIFIPAHFLGWIFKAVLIRHHVLLWTISISWECTELFFSHVLPNFAECWWDVLLFDILICNGLGIMVGMYVCQKLEVKQFHWESIKEIKGAKGKLKRAVLQFTPQSWSKIRWLDPRCTYMRTLAIFALVLMCLISELNTFLLKHILHIPTNHYLVSLRLALICLTASPSIRQYYVYITDKTCKRLGTQAWVYFAIMVSELLISIKFGMKMLPRPALLSIVAWLSVIALASVGIVVLLTRVNVREEVWNWATQSFHRSSSNDIKPISEISEDDGYLPGELKHLPTTRKRRLHKKRARKTNNTPDN